MSYNDLSPSERGAFINMQLRGVRSPDWIRETRRDYPTSPSADRAEELLKILTATERAIIAKLGVARWRRAA